MADRTSAEIFASVFRAIEETVTSSVERRNLARRVLDLSHNFDFSTYQMYVDDVLAKLGITEIR